MCETLKRVKYIFNLKCVTPYEPKDIYIFLAFLLCIDFDMPRRLKLYDNNGVNNTFSNFHEFNMKAEGVAITMEMPHSVAKSN